MVTQLKLLFKSWRQTDFITAWLSLAVGSLLIGGALAFLISLAKVPGLSDVLHQIDFFKRTLVVHVDLSVVVWFMCVPAVLLLSFFEVCHSQAILKTLFFGALIGVLIFCTAGYLTFGKPLMANYLPVTTHPLHIMGLCLFMICCGAHYLLMATSAPQILHNLFEVSPPWDRSLRRALRIGCLYFLLSLTALFLSWARLPFDWHDERLYEYGAWGFGHLQQFANSIFMLVGWVLLLNSWQPQGRSDRRIFDLSLGLYVVPAIIAAFLFFESPDSIWFRTSFTELKRWGIFPPVFLFLAPILWWFLKQGRKANLFDYRFLTVSASVILIIVGFSFGAFVRGPDLKLPGHYHATIGAVTISFMGVCFLIVDRLKGRIMQSRLKTITTILYFLGQLGFSSGLFIAGWFGMGRKTYGVENQIQNSGQQIGLIIMAVGGVFALVGGFSFGAAIFQRLLMQNDPMAKKKVNR